MKFLDAECRDTAGMQTQVVEKTSLDIVVLLFLWNLEHALTLTPTTTLHLADFPTNF